MKKLIASVLAAGLLFTVAGQVDAKSYKSSYKSSYSSHKPVYVKSHYRDGYRVKAHYRSLPRR